MNKMIWMIQYEGQINTGMCVAIAKGIAKWCTGFSVETAIASFPFQQVNLL